MSWFRKCAWMASWTAVLHGCAPPFGVTAPRRAFQRPASEEIVLAALEALPWDSGAHSVCTRALPCDTIGLDPRILSAADTLRMQPFFPNEMRVAFRMSSGATRGRRVAGGRLELIDRGRCWSRVDSPGPLPGRTVCLGTIVGHGFAVTEARQVLTLSVSGPGPLNYSSSSSHVVEVTRAPDGRFVARLVEPAAF